MFYHRPNRIIFWRCFEEQTWKKGESFHNYVYEKVILANPITVNDDEILGYIINDIPDMNLRDLTRVQSFTTRKEMLQAFEEIRLDDLWSQDQRPRSTTRVTAKCKSDKSFRNNKSEKKVASDKKENLSDKRCYNCGEKDHVNASWFLKRQRREMFWMQRACIVEMPE